MSEELKPCPFCGGPVEIEKTSMAYSEIYGRRPAWGVICRNTMNRGGTCAIYQIPSASKEAAIERWNLRAEIAPKPFQTDPCPGMNCGCTDGVSHSPECRAETAATYAGGWFVKGLEKPEGARPAGETMVYLGGGMTPEPVFDAAAVVREDHDGTKHAVLRDESLADGTLLSAQPAPATDGCQCANPQPGRAHCQNCGERILPPATGDEREAFEAEMRARGETYLYRRDLPRSDRFGEYCRENVQDQWLTWQASAVHRRENQRDAGNTRVKNA